MAIAAAGLAACALTAAGDRRTEPFASLAPGVRLDPFDRDRLEAGRPMIKVLPAGDRELAVAAAVRIDASPERFIAWHRQIAALHRSRYVPAIARFSDPPRIEDLDGLTLSAEDVVDLRKCRPGDCGVKLSAPDIERLRSLTREPGWEREMQHEFRRLVLARVEAYRAEGDAGLPPYHDDRTPVAAGAKFASLVDRLGLVAPDVPDVTSYLRQYPRLEHPNVVDSFLYWATETLGAKPTTSVTHVILLRGDTGGEATFAVAKQIFASHYRDGAFSITAITGTGTDRYLTYLHRSDVDVLGGMFGGLIRRVVEGRIRDQAPAVLETVRGRLESGDPP